MSGSITYLSELGVEFLNPIGMELYWISLAAGNIGNPGRNWHDKFQRSVQLQQGVVES